MLTLTANVCVILNMAVINKAYLTAWRLSHCDTDTDAQTHSPPEFRTEASLPTSHMFKANAVLLFGA